MTEGELDVLLPLVAKIAREFSNIPGLSSAEIEMAAQEALVRSAGSFDPSKGDFAPYAAVAIRNSLRDLYESQVRHHKYHLYGLNQPTATSDPVATGCREKGSGVETFTPSDRAASLESAARLNQAMALLSPRLRVVAQGIRDGKSYSEIGSSLGISKQAVQKIAHAAVASLRENLESMGFHELDTLGLLKSGCGVSQQACPRDVPTPQVDDFPSHP